MKSSQGKRSGFLLTMYRKDPYDQLSPLEAATQVSQNFNPLRLEVPKGLSHEMAQIFLHCFETLPADRPTFADIESKLHLVSEIFATE